MLAITLVQPLPERILSGKLKLLHAKWWRDLTGQKVCLYASPSRARGHDHAAYAVPTLPDEQYGALVGLVEIAACAHAYRLAEVLRGRHELRWVLNLPLEGPYTYVLTRVRRIAPLAWADPPKGAIVRIPAPLRGRIEVLPRAVDEDAPAGLFA